MQSLALVLTKKNKQEKIRQNTKKHRIKKMGMGKKNTKTIKKILN